MDIPIELIGSLGFPIFISVWLMYQNSKKDKDIAQALDRNTEVLTELKTVIEKVIK